MLTIWPRPPRLNGHTTRHHQQQSGPAATCPMMAACGVGCWVPSSTGWCRRRCRACARPRRGPGAVGGRSLWSAPAPAPVASCAALRRRSAVCGPGVLRPPIMPKRPCAFAPVRAARPSRCPLLALCGPGGFVRRSWPCGALPGAGPPPAPVVALLWASGGSWGLCGAVGASGGRGSLPLAPSALLRPRGGGPACLAVGGPAVVAPSLCPVLARPGGPAPPPGWLSRGAWGRGPWGMRAGLRAARQPWRGPTFRRAPSMVWIDSPKYVNYSAYFHGQKDHFQGQKRRAQTALRPLLDKYRNTDSFFSAFQSR